MSEYDENSIISSEQEREVQSKKDQMRLRIHFKGRVGGKPILDIDAFQLDSSLRLYSGHTVIQKANEYYLLIPLKRDRKGQIDYRYYQNPQHCSVKMVLIENNEIATLLEEEFDLQEYLQTTPSSQYEEIAGDYYFTPDVKKRLTDYVKKISMTDLLFYGMNGYMAAKLLTRKRR